MRKPARFETDTYFAPDFKIKDALPTSLYHAFSVFSRQKKQESTDLWPSTNKNGHITRKNPHDVSNFFILMICNLRLHELKPKAS
jgi:hypothetical protein